MENETGQKAEQTVYEIGYLVLPSIPEDNLSEVVSAIKSAVAKEGGEVLDGEEPFKIDLSYTMSKTVGASRYVVSEAYLGWLKCELEPAKVASLKASLDGMSELLRFLLVKAPRETTFTFAEARAKLEEKEVKEEPSGEAAPKEAVIE